MNNCMVNEKLNVDESLEQPLVTQISRNSKIKYSVIFALDANISTPFDYRKNITPGAPEGLK